MKNQWTRSLIRDKIDFYVPILIIMQVWEGTNKMSQVLVVWIFPWHTWIDIRKAPAHVFFCIWKVSSNCEDDPKLGKLVIVVKLHGSIDFWIHDSNNSSLSFGDKIVITLLFSPRDWHLCHEFNWCNIFNWNLLDHKAMASYVFKEPEIIL